MTAQRVLEEDAEEPLLLFGRRGERAQVDGFLEAVEAGDADLDEVRKLVRLRQALGEKMSLKDDLELGLMHVSVEGQRAALLTAMTQFVEIAKLPTEEQHQRIREWEEAAKHQPLMVRLVSTSIAKMGITCLRSQAEFRCAFVAVAVERYRLANGRWPESLSALAPKYLKKIPTDPFDGKPLRFAKFDQGVVVYSVGIDRVDNGGHIDPENYRQEGVDLVFRLWDVKHRRQPPQPFKLPEAPQLPPWFEEPADK